VRTVYVVVALCCFALLAPAQAAPAKHPAAAKTSAATGSSGKVTSKDLRGGNFKQSRAAALQKNNGVCEYCQNKPATQGDHVIPVKKYAEKVNSGKISRAGATRKANSEPNVIGACGGRGGCNQQKGGKMPSMTSGKGKWVPPNPTPNAQKKIGSIPKSYR